MEQSEIWQHKKTGGLYRIVERCCLREADLEPMIVYESLFDAQAWVRPASEFMDGRFRNLSVDEVADCTPRQLT